MGRGRRAPKPPVSVRLERLGTKGPLGLDEAGKEWRVRAAPVGALVRAQPGRKQIARRLEILEPAPGQVEPRCPVFGRCGGCQLQEMPLSDQRIHKQRMVEDLVGIPSVPIRGADAAYGYRNKVELSFGPRAYLAEHEKDSGQGEGSFLGFHPPGWFSKIVPLEGCPLASEDMNRVIAEVVSQALGPAWDNRCHDEMVQCLKVLGHSEGNRCDDHRPYWNYDLSPFNAGSLTPRPRSPGESRNRHSFGASPVIVPK